ncbi:hypothetical protein BY458DRAFT_524463 [Sporodiniella umbellata]|nr:hypothetical protein BY458DRAFT_524463 [Sporodiniella umbellata]
MGSIMIEAPLKLKKNTWKWWQSSKNPDEDPRLYINSDENSSITPSSLLAQRSIHSRESEDMESTMSIKSKAWTFPLKIEDSLLVDDTLIPTHLHLDSQPPSTLQPVPSITSSTIPVVNYAMDEPNRKNQEGFFFPSLRAKLGKWVKQ